MNSPSLPAVERLDVQAFINAQPLSPYQWRIVLLCFLIVFLDGSDTAAMGFIAPALTQGTGASTAPASGPVMSAALIGMVFGPSAPDRWPTATDASWYWSRRSSSSACSAWLGLQHQRRVTAGAALPHRPRPRRGDAQRHHLLSGIHPRAPQVAAGDQHVLWLQPGHGLRRIRLGEADPAVRLAQPAAARRPATAGPGGSPAVPPAGIGALPGGAQPRQRAGTPGAGPIARRRWRWHGVSTSPSGRRCRPATCSR